MAIVNFTYVGPKIIDKINFTEENVVKIKHYCDINILYYILKRTIGMCGTCIQ